MDVALKPGVAVTSRDAIGSAGYTRFSSGRARRQLKSPASIGPFRRDVVAVAAKLFDPSSPGLVLFDFNCSSDGSAMCAEEGARRLFALPRVDAI